MFYEDMNMGHSGTRYYPLLFVLRRFVFIILVLLVGSQPWVQVHCFVLGCIIWACFILHSKPSQFRKTNVIEVINEVFLLLVGYLTVCLTGSVVYPAQVFYAGIILLYLVGSMIILNMTFILFFMVRGFILKLQKMRRGQLIGKALRKAQHNSKMYK